MRRVSEKRLREMHALGTEPEIIISGRDLLLLVRALRLAYREVDTLRGFLGSLQAAWDSTDLAPKEIVSDRS